MGERRIVIEADPHGAWEMIRSPVAPGLEGLVRDYVGFREESAARLERRETPSELVTLIVNFGAPLDVAAVGQAGDRLDGSFLARICGTPAVVGFAGVSAGVQIDMSPLGAHMLLDLPMDELPDPVVALADVMGAEGRLLGGRLAAMPGWEERFDYLDDLLLRRFARARAPKASVEWAWRSLLASGGSIPIGRLTDRLACSPNHLIRGFRSQVGVTPKQAGSIIRFGRASRALRSTSPPALAALAAACGYHDQSHMTRDFRRYAGTTPAAYARARHPSFLGVDEDGVNSVQDGGAEPA
jgi:AraC-like DNA-binding protein